jgi:LysR family transcriptional regulator, glycine cleavage system transcriptional activator
VPSRFPPLNACRAFEAAARLGSFARAGTELNVTAAAVSHQVNLLERWSGKRLFNRSHNAVVPTNDARLLAPVITDALEQIGDGLLNLTGDTGPALIRFGVQTDFALKWLIPRLPRFSAAHPRIELNLVTSYRSLDLLSDTLDLAIRYFNPAEFAESGTQLRADHLFTADLVPIVSPTLFPPGRADPAQLRHATLLHVVTALEDWRRWLSAAGIKGIDAERGPKFDSYSLSGEAAAQGWGVALGRIGFIDAEVAAGRLVTPFSTRLPGRRSWVLLTTHRPRIPQVATLRSWLLAEAAAASTARGSDRLLNGRGHGTGATTIPRDGHRSYVTAVKKKGSAGRR